MISNNNKERVRAQTYFKAIGTFMCHSDGPIFHFWKFSSDLVIIWKHLKHLLYFIAQSNPVDVGFRVVLNIHRVFSVIFQLFQQHMDAAQTY